ncbi:1-(5-phosphoribosyl)-5-[(5-phosphoribosylamino)methylideneamino] imidazole-4-carboxamide isomerase [Allosphingosinicella flava]|uniref:1-(5-phosphoribosyl)-5-[(5-phosphoribosylamino)methylideneamino] imidazole-4-carboxamide isomerase n=1 Tax=Allosphingosinicella flava TaxID=2771430 RepID=A0A7T2GI91_9SPHN|nr:1-(5-phosphoribosyl)-5-[(5-phosphoribosylamino)methylideneamino] imidazole-4-carboxamide isomerase [Sphingosinicella flava]QPQ54334.1 1-(5-phosphoribosyl)-5-[(5-phosphoribosylamino)methylideneamino] imidazole-4-carboxamide isomerase [Sphingosinicella flava]
MILYPAMDLMGGRCVRLAQGRFDDATTYSGDPGEALRRFADGGAGWAHVVDLDGARDGGPSQHALLLQLAATAPLRLQVAGGFRTADQVRRAIDAGAARVVIGSLAVKQPDTVRDLIDRFGPDRITLAVDVNIVDGVPVAAVAGWTEASGVSLWDVCALYPAARHLLVTDIGRDGMMSGPNALLIAEIVARFPGLSVQASGGVSGIEDVRTLARTGAAGAIVGKALWEGRIDLAEAVSVAGA